MANSSEFGVGLMHEIAITASKVGYEPKDIANLSKDENLMKLVYGVLKGTHEIKAVEHAIDCDSDPFIPSGWKVEEHQKGGIIKFDASKVSFYLSKKQKSGSSIEGNKLREELKNKKVLNANVLDYLLANPKAIPDEWKKDENGNTRYIFFWGTIYRVSVGDLYVRFLSWDGGEWDWGSFWLGGDFVSYNPSAVLAS
ncbi:MAG: hypothetical protein NT161_01615 [Candidatus Nomurabacteria bacterium]|nr:hypothetical protein [Candidatus Nomurabacteria bacterium]